MTRRVPRPATRDRCGERPARGLVSGAPTGRPSRTARSIRQRCIRGRPWVRPPFPGARVSGPAFQRPGCRGRPVAAAGAEVRPLRAWTRSGRFGEAPAARGISAVAVECALDSAEIRAEPGRSVPPRPTRSLPNRMRQPRGWRGVCAQRGRFTELPPRSFPGAGAVEQRPAELRRRARFGGDVWAGGQPKGDGGRPVDRHVDRGHGVGRATPSHPRRGVPVASSNRRTSAPGRDGSRAVDAP